MCGITGYVDFSGRIFSDTHLSGMTDTLWHRGPDMGNCLREQYVGLGHRRLSILDLSTAASQPFRSRDGRFVVVFNGEIYNFRELRCDLQKLGYMFKTTSDTEVLVHGYEQWGDSLFPLLNGIFAFAIWDRSLESLTLVRDRFGVKPCYYQFHSNGILFGSEIKAILAGSNSRRRIHPTALHEFLYYGNPTGNQTLFEGICKLTPGTFLRVDRNGNKQSAYWRLEDVVPLDLCEQEAIDELRRRLDSAISGQLVSDVPVGVFLSGGIDSSCVTAFAARHYSGKLKTFSASFDFEIHNELDQARMVAEHFGTEHHELHIRGGQVEAVIESLIACHDEPFSDAANIPLYLLCRELGGSPKVILQGDGGDEMFAGYRRYSYLSLPKRTELTLRIGRYVHALLPHNSAWHRRQRFMNAILERDSGMKMARLLTTESPEESPLRILSAEWRDGIQRTDPFIVYRECNHRFSHLDPVQKMLYTDAGVVLPQQFLEKVDKSTMAHGIESRVPFLDHQVSDFAMGVSSQLKTRNGESKRLLKAALRGTVPETILNAPKRGFGVPYGNWLRKPLAGFLRSVLLDTSQVHSTLFNRTVLEHCVTEHVKGRRDFGFLLWKALNLALWCDRYHVHDFANESGEQGSSSGMEPVLLRKTA
jgi:asparagine synthase (glutamine-hydrolysing)